VRPTAAGLLHIPTGGEARRKEVHEAHAVTVVSLCEVCNFRRGILQGMPGIPEKEQGV